MIRRCIVGLAALSALALSACGAASSSTQQPSATQTQTPSAIQPQTVTTTQAPATPTTTPTVSLGVDSPSDGDTVHGANITVAGTATRAAKVTVANGDAGQNTGTAGTDGHWRIPIHVAVGDNNLAVTATRDGFTDADAVDMTVSRPAPPPPPAPLPPGENAILHPSNPGVGYQATYPANFSVNFGIEFGMDFGDKYSMSANITAAMQLEQDTPYSAIRSLDMKTIVRLALQKYAQPIS